MINWTAVSCNPVSHFESMPLLDNKFPEKNLSSNLNESKVEEKVGRPITIVTGANSGLGKECCRQLAGVHGFKTVMACRNREACETARQEILRCHPKADLECAELDLGCLKSLHLFVRNCVGDRPVQAVIHNAGVMAVPFNKTADGFETTFQVNHLSPFHLTKLLLPNMGFKALSEGSKVVVVSSGAHYFGRFDPTNIPGELMYNRWLAYCNTKMYNVMFSTGLNQRYKLQGITSVSMRPGTIATDIGRHSLFAQICFKVFRPFLTPVQEAAGAVVHMLLSNEDQNEGHPGFYNKFVPTTPSLTARNKAFCKQLWDQSEKLLQTWKEKQLNLQLQQQSTQSTKERWSIQKS